MSTPRPSQPSRRGLLKYLGLLMGAAALPSAVRAFGPGPAQPAELAPALSALAAAGTNPHRVVLIKTTDRATGVRQAIELLQPQSFNHQRVFIKPNYNTGDPAPAATDPVILETLVQEIQA
ncbi:MAG: hypothetical protein AAF808_08850, partial [Cyanobacteria bacterium P01_D01_bin.2]